MLKQVRQAIVQKLWERYRETTPQVQLIESGIKRRGINQLVLDHFAIIDLPGVNTGIDVLQQLFSAIGYLVQGRDYLAEKQNPFLWMTESDAKFTPAVEVLPQVVLADFKLDELPIEIRQIIDKYSRQAPPSPLIEIQKLIGPAYLDNEDAVIKIYRTLMKYLSGRDWPLATVNEFRTVHEFNELLAWVLVFGRRPNHFTFSVHHLSSHFSSLDQFNSFVEEELKLELNCEGGVIKGNMHTGIAQSSTKGKPTAVSLLDGTIQLPLGFVEFAWRYPLKISEKLPVLWKDYFTGFVANHANRVVESLYTRTSVTSEAHLPAHVK